MLIAGAVTGLAAGIVAQGAVDGGAHGTQYEWLIRIALILPAVVFLLWWLLFPGIALEEPEAAVAEPIEAEERLERIEATFDSAAVPRARRERLEQVDRETRATYQRSIRRDPELAALDAAAFGIRRPDPAPSRDTAS